MAVFADATIDISADTHRVLPSVQKTLKSAERLAKSQGSAIGDKLGSAIGTHVSESMQKSLAKQGRGGGASKWIMALIPAVPLLTSLVSDLAGGLVALAGSMAQAGAAAASALPLYAVLGQAAVTAKIGMSGLSDAMKAQSAVNAKLAAGLQPTEQEMTKLNEAMKKVSPAGKAMVKSISGLQGVWDKFKKSLQQRLLAGLADDMTRLGGLIKPGSPVAAGLMGMGDQLNLLFKDLGRFVTSTGFVRSFSAALRGNNKIFGTLRQAAVPLLKGMISLLRALQPSANRLAGVIAKGARSFATWAEEGRKTGSIGRYMQKAWKSASLLWGVLKNLGRALGNILGASAKSGDSLMASLERITGQFADWTATIGGKNAIADWASQGVKSFQILGRILGTLGPALGALFNPNMGVGFLQMIRNITPALKSIFAVLAQAVQPIIDALSGPEMKQFATDLGKLFVALAPVLKGVGAILGQMITQALSGLSAVMQVITPIVALLAKVIGPILEKLAPVIAFVILNFVLMGSAGQKVIKALQKMSNPLAKLLGWFLRLYTFVFKYVLKAFGLLGEIFGKFGKMLSPVGSALKTLANLFSSFFSNVVAGAKWLWNVLFGHSIFPDILKAFEAFVGLFKKYVMLWVNLFRLIFRVVSVVLKAMWAVVRWAFTKIRDFISSVLGGIRKTMVRVFSFYKALITRVMNAILGVIRRVWTAIWNTITRILGWIRDRFVTAFAFYKNLIVGVWTWIKDKTSTVWNGIRTTISTVLDRIRNSFRTVVDKIKGIWDGLKRVAAIPVNFLIDTVYNKGIWKLVDLLPGGNPLSQMGSIKFARGGQVKGPGSSTSDSILARLSKDEFVVRAAMARRYKDLLQMINTGRLPGFRKGGMVYPVGYPPSGAYLDPDDAARVRAAGGQGAWDFPVGTGTLVRAPWAGTVTGYADRGRASYGRYLKMYHESQGVGTLYAHLLRPLVGVGQKVAQGLGIAISDNTGETTGPHLHFEITGGSVATSGAGGGDGNLVSKFAAVLKAAANVPGMVRGWVDKFNNGLGSWGPIVKSSAIGAFNMIAKWINDKIPNFLLPDNPIPRFANGTRFAPGGLALVGERGPELVRLPRGSKVNTATQTQTALGLPKRVVLRVGARDFVAYVEELADGRIDAADSLAWQGA